MRPVPRFIRIAVREWLEWVAANRCARNQAVLRRSDPAFAKACDGKAKARRAHKATKPFDAAIRQAMSERLRREIGA